MVGAVGSFLAGRNPCSLCRIRTAPAFGRAPAVNSGRRPGNRHCWRADSRRSTSSAVATVVAETVVATEVTMVVARLVAATEGAMAVALAVAMGREGVAPLGKYRSELRLCILGSVFAAAIVRMEGRQCIQRRIEHLQARHPSRIHHTR